MNRFDAIVIGAGINGLAAATVLARRGQSVCILEQAAHVGGMAALRQADGPALAHLLYNLSPAVLAEMGLSSEALGAGPPLATVSLDTGGRHVVVRGERATTLDGAPHPEAAAWARMWRQLTTYGALLRQLAEAPPPAGGGSLLSRAGLAQMRRALRFGLGVRRLGKPEMRRFLQVLLSNAYDFILDDMPDGPLAGLMAADAVRGMAAGPRSPGTVLSLIYRMGHGGDMMAPEGGVGAVMTRLAEAAQRAGCALHTGTGVTRVLLEDDAVTGVETATGAVFHAPVVLGSVGPQELCRLTGVAAFDIEAARRIRVLRARGTVAKVDMLLDTDRIPGLPDDLARGRVVLARSAHDVEAAFTPAKYGALSEAPVIEAVPVTTQDGRTWLSANVQYAPSDLAGGWTEAARQTLADRTLDALGAALPDLPGRVERMQTVTPDQVAAATGAAGGHWHHAELAMDQLFTLRPGNGMGRHAMGPRGLYLCGAAAHPGGDVMGLAGRNAALVALEAMS